MAQLIKSQKIDKEELKPKNGARVGTWNMHSTRIGADGVERVVRYAKLSETELNEQENEDLADSLIKEAESGKLGVSQYRDRDGNIVPNKITGFARHIKELAQTKREAAEQKRVQGGIVTDEGEPVTLSEELKRHARKMSEKTGFSEYVEKEAGDEGYEFHDGDRMQTGNDSPGFGIDPPPGFNADFHGTPEDDYPKDRDKDEPYGGNAVAGAVRKSRFTKPGPQKKEKLFDDFGDAIADIRGADEDNKSLFEENTKPTKSHQREAGSGTTREENSDPIDTVTPLTSESPRTERLQDQYHYDLLPQEPGRVDVPGHDGGGKDIVDPLGPEDENFEWNEEGTWRDPGMSQDYPDKKVKVTPIVGVKKVKSRTGRIYIGKIVRVAKEFIVVDGVRLGDTTRNNYRILRADVEDVQDYNVVPRKKQAGTSLAGIYDEVGGQDNKMEKTAAVPILKKYFGMTGDAPELDKDKELARIDRSKGDGELYGDDKGLKDQLDFHEKKMAKLKLKIASLVRSSEIFEKEGKEAEAEACLKQAEDLNVQIKNSTVRMVQLKKEASAKLPESKMFFHNSEDGREGMFD